MKNIKLSVRLEESNIERLKIKADQTLKKTQNRFHRYCLKKKKKVCTSNISTHSVGGRNTETYLEENMAK